MRVWSVEQTYRYQTQNITDRILSLIEAIASHNWGCEVIAMHILSSH